MVLLFKGGIFRFHRSFWGCSISSSNGWLPALFLRIFSASLHLKVATTQRPPIARTSKAPTSPAGHGNREIRLWNVPNLQSKNMTNLPQSKINSIKEKDSMYIYIYKQHPQIKISIVWIKTKYFEKKIRLLYTYFLPQQRKYVPHWFKKLSIKIMFLSPPKKKKTKTQYNHMSLSIDMCSPSNSKGTPQNKQNIWRSMTFLLPSGVIFFAGRILWVFVIFISSKSSLLQKPYTPVFSCSISELRKSRKASTYASGSHFPNTETSSQKVVGNRVWLNDSKTS